MGKQKQNKVNIKYRTHERVHLIHVSCVKIPVTNYEHLIKILKNPRHPIIKNFIIGELSECDHTLGNIVKKLDLTTFYYEPTDHSHLDLEGFYVNVKFYLGYKHEDRTRKKSIKKKIYS